MTGELNLTSVGGALAATLCTLFLAEVLAILLSARTLMLKPFDEDEEIKPEGREYAQRSLTLGGLTFASIAILFDAFRSSLGDVADVFLLLVLSLGFLFLCYSVEALVRQGRIFWIIEDKSLNMGYLSIVLALLVLLQYVLPDAFVVLGLLTVALFAVHCVEYYSDFCHWRQRGRSAHNHK